MTDTDAARRLAAIVQWSDDAIIGMSLDAVMTTWNRGAERMYGYSADEAIGRSVRLLVPPERWDEEDQILARIRAGETVEHFETVRIDRCGRRLNVSVTMSPIRDDAGTIVGASKIARDITRQKRIEEGQAFLLEAGDRLAQAVGLSATLEAIVRLPLPRFADWCFLYVTNEKGLLERTQTAFADPSWAGLAAQLQKFPPAALPRPIRTAPTLMREITAEFLTGVAQNEAHLALMHAIGPHSILTVPVKLGRYWAAALTFMYVAASGRQYAEDDLGWAAEFGSRAGGAIERARLYQELEDANRLKDDFLATLSHELRTPLNAILGYARMLKSGTLTADAQQHAIAVVERNGRTLAELVADVLDVSRIASGKLRLNIQAIDVATVMADAMDAIRPAADAKGIELRQSIEAESHQVSGDAERLQQVCWNLLSNAVKFTPRGGRVLVHVGRRNSQVVLSVTDTGLGLRPEFRPFVFERFRQADSRTTREYGGLGLGLAIVRHLVELHGGTVDAESEGEGKGSTFTVRLPLRSVSQAAPMPAHGTPAAAVEAGAAPMRLDGITVLAVDDERDSLDLVADVLRNAGAVVLTADSALRALEAVARARPDVIVADIGMPHMDGYEFIRRLRNAEVNGGRFTPAAALTAYARPEDRARALGAGFTTHVAKPVDPAQLVAIVATLSHREQ